MAFLSEMNPETGFIAPIKDKGSELAERYNAAAPFPHIVIDDFLPRPVIDRVLGTFGGEDVVQYNGDTQRLKSQFQPEQMAPGNRALFYAFNSLPFIRLLENITGIQGLIPDPYFMGAGFHEIKTGGHLSIHADFNHHKRMDLERRINVLIYLNDDWEDAHGGQLELWDKGMKACQASVVPLANRCVIFNTTGESFHGNPQAVNHPEGRPRRSIALYYYTSTWKGQKRKKNTSFQVRPGTTDRPDRKWQAIELARDWMPPVLFRALRRGAE